MDEGTAEVDTFEAVFFGLEGGDLADVVTGNLVKKVLEIKGWKKGERGV